ncbi:MAG TPA: hypothetical protein VKG22_09885 [Stellaceae bacterium]|nr:hypothetical protein [Stellaceae bacterium]
MAGLVYFLEACLWLAGLLGIAWFLTWPVIRQFLSILKGLAAPLVVIGFAFLIYQTPQGAGGPLDRIQR